MTFAPCTSETALRAVCVAGTRIVRGRFVFHSVRCSRLLLRNLFGLSVFRDSVTQIPAMSCSRGHDIRFTSLSATAR